MYESDPQAFLYHSFSYYLNHVIAVLARYVIVSFHQLGFSVRIILKNHYDYDRIFICRGMYPTSQHDPSFNLCHDQIRSTKRPTQAKSPTSTKTQFTRSYLFNLNIRTLPHPDVEIIGVAYIPFSNTSIINNKTNFRRR